MLMLMWCWWDADVMWLQHYSTKCTFLHIHRHSSEGWHRIHYIAHTPPYPQHIHIASTTYRIHLHIHNTYTSHPLHIAYISHPTAHHINTPSTSPSTSTSTSHWLNSALPLRITSTSRHTSLTLIVTCIWTHARAWSTNERATRGTHHCTDRLHIIDNAYPTHNTMYAYRFHTMPISSHTSRQWLHDHNSTQHTDHSSTIDEHWASFPETENEDYELSG